MFFRTCALCSVCTASCKMASSSVSGLWCTLIIEVTNTRVLSEVDAMHENHAVLASFQMLKQHPAHRDKVTPGFGLVPIAFSLGLRQTGCFRARLLSRSLYSVFSRLFRTVNHSLEQFLWEEAEDNLDANPSNLGR